MTSVNDTDRVVVLLKRLARTHLVAGACIAELQQRLSDAGSRPTDLGPLANLLGSRVDDPAAMLCRPIVNMTAMTVTWAGRSCHLGDTVLLRLLERLARRPNHFLSYDRLKREVWDARRSEGAIRNAIHRLKSLLRENGMGELADKIRSARGQWALILDPAD